MPTNALSPKRMQVGEIACLVLLAAVMVFGALYQYMGWKVDGAQLVLVAILVINYVNLVRAQLGEANARIDALEQRLAATGR
jgi:hypothetical protein